MICKRCNGTGHDKPGRPVIKFTEYKDTSGRARRQHVTVEQGSGCMTCLGRGQT